MARYYASIQGNRGEATRMGTPSSGITAHPRGWRTGIRVHSFAESDRFDTFFVDVTGGSGYGRSVSDVLTVTEQSDGERIVVVRLPGRETIAVRYDADWQEVSPADVAAPQPA